MSESGVEDLRSENHDEDDDGCSVEEEADDVVEVGEDADADVEDF